MYAIYKLSPGLAKQRLTIKCFTDNEARWTFLCHGSNGLTWYELDPKTRPQYPTKAGVYAYAGGQWHNVRSLDPSILAHI